MPNGVNNGSPRDQYKPDMNADAFEGEKPEKTHEH
jgi:hypothetical protein